MGLTSAECARMIEACEQNGVKLAVCFYQRFNARHQKMRDMIADGHIGQVVGARIQFGQYYPETEGSWRQIPEMGGGGTIMDTGSHCVDTLRALLNAEVDEVLALVDTLVFSYPVDDTTSMLLRFDNGVQGVVTSYWNTPDVNQTSLNIVEVYGTSGQLVGSPINAKNSDGFLKAYTTGEWTEHYFEKNTHAALLDAFAACIEHDGPSPIPGEDGMRGMQVIEAALESARTGRIVKVG